MIDDVFSHPSDEFIAKYKGTYKLLSQAIKAGLLHPNCRHTIITYFDGVTQLPKLPDPDISLENYNNEQRQRKLENKLRKAKRIASGVVDAESEQKAVKNVKHLQKELRDFLKVHSEFKHQRGREKIYEKNKISSRLNMKEQEAIVKYISPDAYKLNDKLRNGTELTKVEQRWVDNLDTALDKMPVYEGAVTRSLEFMYKEDVKPFISSYVVGKTIKYSEFISSTCGEVYNKDAQVQLVIQSKNGRDVRFYNQTEQEVLFKRGTTFKVNNVTPVDKITIIVLEEE